MPGGPQSMSASEVKSLMKMGREDDTTLVNVSVAIWFTKEFAAIENDVQGYIDTMFEEGNACLKNSLVPMRLVHHGTYPFEGEEIRDASAMLDKFGGWPNMTHRDIMLKTADAAQ